MTAGGLALLVLAGALSGSVNTVAGGGSFVALSALVWLGLPAGVANGTNRIAVLAQSLSALQASERPPLDAGLAAELAVSGVGALAGAALAVVLPADRVEDLLAVAMIAGVGWSLLRPAAFAGGGAASPARWPLLLLAGAYGGFLQAGVGLVLLPILVRAGGHDAVSANVRKVFLVAALSVPALATFLAAGLVDWPAGLALAAGSAVGGRVGARAMARLGPTFVWRAMAVLVAVTALRLVLGG